MEKLAAEEEKREIIEENSGENVRRWSLSARVRMLLAGIILIILIAFTITSYAFSRRERMNSAVRESESLLISISNSIYSDVEGYKELSRLIMIEDRLVSYLRANKKEIDKDMINNGRYGIMDILNVTVNVDSVFVFREDGEYLSTNRGAYLFDYERMAGEEWDAEILAAKGRSVISINGNNTISKTNGKPVITIGRAIYDLLSQERTGLLLMNISDAVLSQNLRAARNDTVCILDCQGNYLVGNEDIAQYFKMEFTGSQSYHETVKDATGQFLVSGLQMEEMPLVILTETRLNEKPTRFESAWVLLVLLAVVVLVAFFAGGFITKNITAPVFRLTAAMEKNREEGKLEHVNVVHAQNEIGMLEDGYNNMIDHVNDLITRLIEKEKTLQKAEMRVLHEQIKPHFLYNSLETIGFLAMDAGAEEVHSALETLGSFYRNFLSKGDREIPLRREVCIVQDYLALQKLRYGDILEDEYDIAEDTRDCIIPKLILQPLVENSIYHGIRLKGEPGVIKITSRLHKGVLHVYVRDTGVGMSKGQIDAILKPGEGANRESSSDPSESFGLWGTIERIRCFCDDEDIVKIRSEEGEYTEVEFIIPQEDAKELRHKQTEKQAAENLRAKNDRRSSRKKDRRRKKHEKVQSDDHR